MRSKNSPKGTGDPDVKPLIDLQFKLNEQTELMRKLRREYEAKVDELKTKASRTGIDLVELRDKFTFVTGALAVSGLLNLIAGLVIGKVI